jgi:hypothetical protein
MSCNIHKFYIIFWLLAAVPLGLVLQTDVLVHIGGLTHHWQADNNGLDATTLMGKPSLYAMLFTIITT